MEKNRLLYLTLILCLILSIFNLFFALTAKAYPMEHPSDVYHTTWYFDTLINPFPYANFADDTSQQIAFSFGDGTGPYTNIKFDGESLFAYFSPTSRWQKIYSVSTGWVSSQYRSWYFDTSYQDDLPIFYEWLNDSAICIKYENESFPIASVSIAGSNNPSVFTFAGSTLTSNIQLTVASNGARFVSGLRSRMWANLTDLTFSGFSIEQDNIPEYVVGQTYTINGGLSSDTSLILYPCYGDVVLPSVDLKIYNQSGSSLLFSKVYSQVNTAPLVTVLVETDRIEILIDNAVVDIVPMEKEDGFLGISDKPNQSTALWPVGSTFELGGTSSSSSFKYYTVWFGGQPVLPVVDWTSWISSAVSGFFSFSFWPGLTLGELFLTLLAIAIFFAFLKMTI